MPEETPNLPAQARLQLPANVREQMAAEAAEIIASRVAAPTGSRIAIDQSKQFKLPDGTMVRDALDVIVVDFVAAQFWYEKAFDRDQLAPPMCFAIGLDPKALVPSPNGLIQQSEGKSCSECWAFQWGSDRNGGRGKDCSTNVLLACLFPDATPESPLMTVRVSSTAAKHFNSYVSLLARVHSLPPYAFATSLRFDPSVSYASLRFVDPRPLDDETLAVVMSHREAARQLLMTEPDMTQARLEREKQEAERAQLKAPARPRGAPAPAARR